MGNQSLFPVVAVPRAFFGTFFRFERKYCPPTGRQPHRPRRSRRVNPPAGIFLHAAACRGLSARPLHPFGSPAETKKIPTGRQVPSRTGVGMSYPCQDQRILSPLSGRIFPHPSRNTLYPPKLARKEVRPCASPKISPIAPTGCIWISMPPIRTASIH